MSVPNPQALRFFDPYDTASYWCAETSTAFGPDGQPVDRTAASTAGLLQALKPGPGVFLKPEPVARSQCYTDC